MPDTAAREVMRAELERVHVIGGAGAGKTTVARQLAVAYSLPHHELDAIMDIDAVVLGERWVTDGIFLWHVERLLDAAQLIIWVDLPMRLCLWRIVLRHVRASASGNNRHRGLRRLARFLRSVRRADRDPSERAPSGPRDFDACTRAATRRVLEPYAAKVVCLRSAREADRIVAVIRSQALACR